MQSTSIQPSKGIKEINEVAVSKGEEWTYPGGKEFEDGEEVTRGWGAIGVESPAELGSGLQISQLAPGVHCCLEVAEGPILKLERPTPIPRRIEGVEGVEGGKDVKGVGPVLMGDSLGVMPVLGVCRQVGVECGNLVFALRTAAPHHRAASGTT